MHAARAIHKQREKLEKKEEKLKVEVRRPSVGSQISRFPRSPVVSNDTTLRRTHSSGDSDCFGRFLKDSERLNFSYIGFIIAAFGAVPLLVGTFVEVPALWEVGLVITLLGIFIGLIFWCTELCAEAKRFSQNKKKMSTRGKIEDSNLLQVPDRKSHRVNGLTSESRRNSFQSDSVSLISPAVNFNSSAQLNNHFPGDKVGIHDLPTSASQYSISEASKGYDSPLPLHLPLKDFHRDVPKRGHSGAANRVVSLVQQERGFDDSDSDAETVIEAPTGKTKIIQVQSCQEKSSGVNFSPATTTKPPGIIPSSKPYLPNINFDSQHRTIHMPVMPQEVEKLKKCECGRYLLDQDTIKSHFVNSLPSTRYGSPTHSMKPTRKASEMNLFSNDGGSSNNLSLDNFRTDMITQKGNAPVPSISSIVPTHTHADPNSVITTTQPSINSDKIRDDAFETRHTDSGESVVVEVEPALSQSTATLVRNECDKLANSVSDLLSGTETENKFNNVDEHLSLESIKSFGEEEEEGNNKSHSENAPEPVSSSAEDLQKVVQDILSLTDVSPEESNDSSKPQVEAHIENETIPVSRPSSLSLASLKSSQSQNNASNDSINNVLKSEPVIQTALSASSLSLPEGMTSVTVENEMAGSTPAEATNAEGIMPRVETVSSSSEQNVEEKDRMEEVIVQ